MGSVVGVVIGLSVGSVVSGVVATVVVTVVVSSSGWGGGSAWTEIANAIEFYFSKMQPMGASIGNKLKSKYPLCC